MIVLLDVPFGTFETFSVTFSLLIVLKSFFLGKSGIASDRVGDLPRQPSSLTFFLLKYAVSPATSPSREVCLWSVRREDFGTGEDVGVQRVVALMY